MQVNEVTGAIIRCAMKVHSALGPGLLESAYEACLAYELRKAGFEVRTQVGLPVEYDGVQLELGYRLDIVVNDLVIVELKACEAINRVHLAQVISYLKLSGKRVGLIINFHELHLKDGIRRFVNRDYKTSVTSVASVVEEERT